MTEIGEQLPDVMWRLDAHAFHQRVAEQTLTPGGPSPILLRDLAARSADVETTVGREFLVEIEFDQAALSTDDPAALYLTCMAPYIIDVEPVVVDWLLVEAALGVATGWLGEEVKMLRYGGGLPMLPILLGYPDFAEMLHGRRLNAGWLSANQAEEFRVRLESEPVFANPNRGQLRSMRWLEDNGIDLSPAVFAPRLADAADQLGAHLGRIAHGGGHVIF